MDNIIQRVRHLPYEMFIKMNRSLKESPVSSLGQSAFSGLQNKMDRGAFNKKGDFKKAETSVTEGGIHEPICTAVTSMMKGQVTTLASGLAGDTANKKKGDQKNKGSSTREDNAKISKVTPTTTSVRSKDTQEHAAPTVNEIQRKDSSARKYTKGQGNKTHHQHFLPATNDAKNKKAGLELDFKTQAKKKSEEKRVNSLEKEGVPFKLPPLKSKVKTRETRGASLAYSVTNGKQILHPKHLQDVSKGIWSNALGISSFQGPIGDSTSQSPLNDKVACVTKGDSKASLTDFTSHTAPALEEKDENGKNKEANSTPSEPDGPQNQPENNPGILPSGLLEDIISGIVDKLIFSPSEDTDDGCGNVASSINQNQLCDAAMKLIDSLLREFSNAQIKGLNQNQGNQPSSPADKASSVHKGPLRQKEPSVDKAPSEIKMIIRDKIPSMHKMPPASKTPSSDGIPLRAKTPSIDKAWVNKVVHSSVCNILQEYRSQDSVCNDINSNSEHLAKRLANAVIEEIFQHQLNWILYNEVPISVVPLPLESNEFIKKFRKVPRTACKECQTSWPYTIILPREFLESIISSLLSKIFSTVANTKMELSDGDLYTQLDFFQMKLVSTVMTELSKDERMSIQYIESLHPNDDEMIQLVVQTIYNNLLEQFESQESIQNCIIRGCRTITETIVNLVVQEVAGNQLQNYFSGELTPCQCTEVDNVVENILKDVTQTSGLPSHHPSRTFKLPFNLIEEIAVHFLSKLLSFFPKDDKESNKSLNIEMQEIASKILKSFQDYMYESQIEVVAQAKEPPTSLLANSATIEKVVTSVYSTVLKYSGSHISMYKDLMGKSKVLSDIIGFLMVKEISNSEFHPQIEEAAASSSELILETVTIMEKVTKLIDNLKLKENPSSRKDVMLDIMFVEEILALFLARLVKLPSASSKYAKNVSKPELNKIASQLTKSVTAEISRNNINVVAANSEEHFLSPESTEIIPQIVDSVYSHILQQFGTHKDLYYDMKGTNRFFPHKVASLIISTILNCPLETVCSKYSHADLFADVDVSRIVEKTQEHAVKMEPNIGKKELDQDLKEKELPVKIIPHCGKQPVNIDPNIVAEHLGVISIKTQSLKTLKMDCLAKTGHSIEALRRAVISGRRYATDLSTTEERKKEKRVSLDKTGRLNVKPLEIASRNSFRNLLKPDITKVELLKDVQNKKDLIIRLVAHDIDQEESENRAEEGLTSDEDEVVLQEIIKEDFSESPLDGQVKEEDKEPMASTVVALKPPANKSNLKNFLSLGKCCSPRSSETVKSIEASPKQSTEPEEAQQKRIVSVSDVTTSKSSTDTDSSLWKKKRQSSVEEIKSPTEPSLFFLHKLMSASSYNEDDLPSLSSNDCPPDPSAKITEESLADLDLEHSESVKFTTLFQRGSALNHARSSHDNIPDANKPSTSKQGSQIMKKMSAVLSKVFSKSNANLPESSSPPPQLPHRDTDENC
ncbi:fibrous sheath-interacting protein 2 isoform X2 [Tupaia chinensis]|uniref:fibrous sheath-interacting protein 2 isoform X2 n=1 Tax=Tupaia chinensis TaxID=246437 RepID=UPI0003C8DBA7|nr:fibrous sheath-interacting protein 2 isoform X2 [Tupaia chinensis]